MTRPVWLGRVRREGALSLCLPLQLFTVASPAKLTIVLFPRLILSTSSPTSLSLTPLLFLFPGLRFLSISFYLVATFTAPPRSQNFGHLLKRHAGERYSGSVDRSGCSSVEVNSRRWWCVQ